MDEEWRFKSMNMGRELEVAGEFVWLWMRSELTCRI